MKDIHTKIIKKAKELGASLAGIASVETLRNSPPILFMRKFITLTALEIRKDTWRPVRCPLEKMLRNSGGLRIKAVFGWPSLRYFLFHNKQQDLQ